MTHSSPSSIASQARRARRTLRGLPAVQRPSAVRPGWARVLLVAASVPLALAGMVAMGDAMGGRALAQGFNWPWESERPRPVPREPVYREPARQAPSPVGNGWEARDTNSSICLTLEQRLVQEGKRGDQSRSQLPRLEGEIRSLEREVRQLDSKLERSDCYEWFLFSKQLRNTRACHALVRDVEEKKRQLSELEGERQQLTASGGRSYQDEIIRELARNNCGSSYQQEARRRDGGGSAGLWQDEDSGGAGGGARFNALPFATYRTVCVRLCDGYYFPISFSTLPNHFQRDAEACQQKCAAPAQLYYYQNPGGAIDQMVAAEGNERYTKLRTAFLYRKEYVRGCSCKQEEYAPQSLPAGSRQAEGTAGTIRSPQIGDAIDPWRPR